MHVRLMSTTSERIYLNNAATGWPKAPGVSEAVYEALQNAPVHPGRGAVENDEILTECRERLAALLSVDDPSRIALTMHATQALNLAIFGISLSEGARVITTVTEHNSVLRPLNHVKKQRDIQITAIGLNQNGSLDVDAFDEALDSSTFLVVMNHASNVTGRINDVGPFFRKAKEAGAVTILDAAQSLGHIPVCPNELSADIVALTGHKGLRGPSGTGGLWVAPHIELEQTFVGGSGIKGELELHPAEMPTRLEAGTPNVPAIAGLIVALRWLESEGREFHRKERELTRLLYHELRRIPGARLFDDFQDADGLGIASFAIEGCDVGETGLVLAERFNVMCRTGCHCAPLIHKVIGSEKDGTIRFSLSGFNTEEEILKAVDAVRQVATETRSIPLGAELEAPS